MTNYTILLPPSEGKADGGDDSQNWTDLAENPDKNCFHALNPQRRTLLEALQNEIDRADRADLRKLFGVKGDNLDAAIAANRSVLSGPVLPAIQRYTGVMFDYLDYPSLEGRPKMAFESNTILFSGLWGLLRPTDPIPDYKLKINASVGDLGRLHTFWKPHISELLNPILAGQVVWDMLPNAHRKAWKVPSEKKTGKKTGKKSGMAAHYEVKFVQRVLKKDKEKKGKVTYRTVSHWSKALKGALIRYICANDITRPDDLHGFEHPQGYVYSPEQSDVTKKRGEVVFVKE